MKTIIKFVKKIVGNFWVRLVFLLGCVVGIFALGGAFESASTSGDKILEIVTSVDVLSVFLVAAISLIVADIVFKSKKVLEESLKIDDDHHKIVCKYNKHNKTDKITDRSYCDKTGAFMYLDKLPPKRKLPKNPVNDKYSDGYKHRRADCEAYVNGRLYLPSVCVFANAAGDTEIKFNDSISKYELPRFVTENALLLMEAHATSNVNNSVTIRLNDFDYDGGVLTLDTCRSQYYDMLVTNRCMDYELGGAVSVRKVYEYGDAVTPLEKSVLCNQIGINGLIVTRDGYLLLEKRGHNKTTWKNKFAQPISLALKLSDVTVGETGEIGGATGDAEAVFKKVILGTVAKNFGLAEDDITGFSLETNFMGIARDLLEGGKPNMYFYIVTKASAKELAKTLEKKSRLAALNSFEPKKTNKKLCAEKTDGKKEPLPKLTLDKLDSSFYLVKYDDIEVNYNYELKIKPKSVLRLRRKYSPRVGRLSQAFDGFGYRVKRAFNIGIKRECGEALLACLYFAGTCPRVYDGVGASAADR